jgi:F-type H+-transporting ATPase subunit b
MELNWTTFLLEIINFLVLVWILKRFLYKPVLDVIARRRSGIENQLHDAHQLQDEANQLKAEYENRLADWEKERQQLRDKLAQELDEERARQLDKLQKTLAQEREKIQVAESRRQAEVEREIEHRALRQGALFASRLLARAAGPELQTRLVQLFLEDISSLDDDRISGLRSQWGETTETIEVISAYPVEKEQQKLIESELLRIRALDVPVAFTQNPELLAGLRITIGAWILHIDLRDELKGFAEFTHATR